jgi:hypothetical protein
MWKHLLLFILGLSLISLLTGCNSVDKNSTRTFHVLSLLDNLPRVDQEAKKWHQNAYFYLVFLDPYINDIYPSDTLSVYYYSPFDTNSDLGIFMQIDGTIKTYIDTFSIPPDPNFDRPINQSDILIDSPEALDIFLKDHDVQIFLNEHTGDIHLKMRLYHEPYLMGAPLLWEMSISSYSPMDSIFRYVYMTGYVLSINKK